jgi:glutathione S-transferase
MIWKRRSARRIIFPIRSLLTLGWQQGGSKYPERREIEERPAAMTISKPAQPIVLFGFGPKFDLPEASPFVMKTETQLRMAGLPYEKDLTGRAAAPKGKLPYIKDGAAIVADSTFIRQHLEWSYGVDFDAGYGLAERAQGWAVERLLEDHLYWIAMKYRWLDPVNFAKGPAHFFDSAPADIRDKLREEAREGVRQRMHGHGIGRHSDEDVLFLATHSLYSLATLLGDKPYLLGDRPCGTDATALAMLAAIMTPFFPGDLRDTAMGFDNLYPYVLRMLDRYYADVDREEWPAAQQAALSCVA